MNDSVQTPETAVAPPKKRRFPAILLLLGVFLFGMLCGVGLAIPYVMHQIREGFRHPEHRSERMVRLMSERLELTPDQAGRIRKILAAQDKELEELRRQNWPKVAARFERTEKEIGETLNPEQLKKWRELSAGMHRRWMSPAPGGMRPPPDGRRGDGRAGEPPPPPPEEAAHSGPPPEGEMAPPPGREGRSAPAP